MEMNVNEQQNGQDNENDKRVVESAAELIDSDNLMCKLKKAVVIIECVAGDTEAMFFVDCEFHVLLSQKAMRELVKHELKQVLH
ncbi:hypothetical protein GX51_00695 [Blastomyces parvus]|uniref:Uncharacterized protein n=1 Tax=Blastomyces parvus TaxID=2060905 RepID=A0A2B7XKD6_9EURO|nr:hypothetical protein GX51_00695 [Blastomyces parvus]